MEARTRRQCAHCSIFWASVEPALLCLSVCLCVLDVGDTMCVVVVSWQAKTLSTDDNYLQITHLVQLQALSADQWYYHCVCTVGKLLTACLRVDIG